jgi:CBS domain-containing protein
MDVQDVMTRSVCVVAPEASLREVAALLVEHGISGLPVCNAEGAVVGVVSETDILYKERGAKEEGDGLLARFGRVSASRDAAKATARTAGEAMTSPPITIMPYRPIAAAARLMLEHGVNRLPVVRNDRLVGIVTRADLVRAFDRTDAEIEDEIRTEVIGELMWLEPTGISLAVDHGEVELSGEIEGRLDAELLAKLAARVPGVLGVRSEITWRVDDTKWKAARAAARM